MTHRLKVLLFGVADVTPDFFIHGKYQLLGRRQGSDRVRTLRKVKNVKGGSLQFKEKSEP